MRLKNLSLSMTLGLFLSLFGGEDVVFSETTVEEQTTQTQTGLPVGETAAQVAPEKILGSFEIRPSLASTNGESYNELNGNAGYQWNPNTSLDYSQNFRTNIYNPNNRDAGLEAKVTDGFFRFKANNIYLHRQTNTLVSYEGRLVLPTDEEKSKAGFVSELRNYVKLSKAVNNFMNISLFEAPSFFFNTQAGGVKSGKQTANPTFANRVILVTDFTISKGLAFTFPITYKGTLFSNYLAGSAHNGAWENEITVYPELAYQVIPNATVGVAFSSENLITPDFSGIRIGDGLNQGASQLVLRASL